MFSKNYLKSLLVFDLECVGSTNKLEEQPERFQDLWKKRCVYLKSKEGEDKTEDILWETNAGINPEFGKIIVGSFGYFTEDDNGELQTNITSYYGDDEKEVLETIKKLLIKSAGMEMTLCGHNIKGFDLPYLAKRMVINKIMPPNILQTHDKKPWEISVLDTQEAWSFGSRGQGFTSLDLLTASLGLPSPKDVMDGSQVHDAYYNQNQLEDIKEYCEKDVNQTMEVLKRISFPEKF
jgi:DNA polymerase elongation subunit (family B)